MKWARKELDEMKVPILAALAAGIFAIQAMNIPIGMGTSGHMVGAALVAIVFGSPWAGVLVLTLVLLVQGFAFGDGGITTMGANILNMGIISGFVGYYTYVALRKSTGTSIAAFGGAWLGLFISAIVCAVQMWLAGHFPSGSRPHCHGHLSPDNWFYRRRTDHCSCNHSDCKIPP